MTIKSDRWIRKMAEESGMIEPFAPNQVRLGQQGEKVISYGTSSYGYDVRCSSEFKVFTNLHSVTVDPKNFDEKSFAKMCSCLFFNRNVYRAGSNRHYCWCSF